VAFGALPFVFKELAVPVKKSNILLTLCKR
jgi:hypothetical protein